ncbi:hypothetical protein LINGRAPRIM_LOCUS3063 [Linum grandiflorum]
MTTTYPARVRDPPPNVLYSPEKHMMNLARRNWLAKKMENHTRR